MNEIRRALGTNQWQELVYFAFGAGIGSKLRHDTVNDWVRDLYGLAGRIVKHLTGTALGQMQFEFLTDLGRDLILEVVSEFGEKLLACDHVKLVEGTTKKLSRLMSVASTAGFRANFFSSCMATVRPASLRRE